MNQENGFMFAPAPFRLPAFTSLGQTAPVAAPVVVPAPAVMVSQGVALAPIIFAAGTILLVTELAGVTHVMPWLKKAVGLGGKSKGKRK